MGAETLVAFHRSPVIFWILLVQMIAFLVPLSLPSHYSSPIVLCTPIHQNGQASPSSAQLS